MTATTFGAGSLVGVPVRRVEDPTLLRGEGTYIDNLPIEGALHLAFVRSPAAHAEIRSIDMTDARAMPGVVAVYSAEDLDFPDHTGMMQLHPAAIRHSLAQRQGPLRRRHRGGGRGRDQGASGRRGRSRHRRLRPAARGGRHGVGDGAGLRRASSTPCRRTSSWARASPTATTPLAGADVIVRGRFENQRLAVVPMEGAAIAVIPGDDGDGHQLTVYLGCQMPHMNRGGLAAGFGLEPDSVRLIAPHVGGSFGGEALGARGHRRGEGRARARPAGEVDRDPLREHDLHAPRARSGAVPRDGPAQRRHHRGPALPDHRRRGRVRRLRRHARVRTDAHDVAGRVPHPRDRVRRRRRGHQPRADGGVPRRRSSGSGGDARAHPRHGRRRSWASTPSSSAVATSSDRTSSRTRPSPASPTTSATTTPR